MIHILLLLAALAGLWWLNRVWRQATAAVPLAENDTGELEEIVGNLGGCVTLLLALVVLGVLALVMWG